VLSQLSPLCLPAAGLQRPLNELVDRSAGQRHGWGPHPPALAGLDKTGAVIADTHRLLFDPELSVRIAAVTAVGVTMMEDQLFEGAGDRLVAEMVRMLVGAARYIPDSTQTTWSGTDFCGRRELVIRPCTPIAMASEMWLAETLVGAPLFSIGWHRRLTCMSSTPSRS
jgi:hypothetical protein